LPYEKRILQIPPSWIGLLGLLLNSCNSNDDKPTTMNIVPSSTAFKALQDDAIHAIQD
jgi:hypothetical protein